MEVDLPDTTGNYSNLVRAQNNATQFRLNVQNAMLGNNQEIAIGRVESFLAHIFTGCVEQNAQALLQCWVSGACDKVQAVNPVHVLIQVEGVPS